MAEEWKRQQNREKLNGKTLYVTCECQCWKINEDGSEEVPELISCQEEADTRLVLHAKHSSDDSYAAVIVNSEDTDVFILLVAFCRSIDAKLYQRCGTPTCTKLVDIGKVALALGERLCRGLIGLHAFTGCDTVSAFSGKGKLIPFKLMKAREDVREAYIKLGEAWNLSDELLEALDKVTCSLYTPSTATASNINDVRYNLFCAKNGEIESHLLPPCKDCLSKHAMRANYQACIWRRSLERNPVIPSPVGMGWEMETLAGSQVLSIDWMEKKPAPAAVLELLACKCKSCPCVANGLKCTDICALANCENQVEADDEIEVGSLDVDDDPEEE